MEVDLIIDDTVAIEIKSTNQVADKHLKGLRALKEENIHKRFIAVSLDETCRRTRDGIEIMPYGEFLKALWSGNLA